MFIPLDADGYLINLADAEKVDRPWLPLIESLVDEYRARYPDLASIYVRGSVATGTAVFGYSDLDLIAVTYEESAFDRVWMAEAVERTLSRHSVSVDIDLATTSAKAVLTDRKSGFYIKTQSALMYGEDFAPRISPYRIDPDAFSHLFNLELDLSAVRYAMDGASEALAQTLVLRLVKRVLRAGLELFAERQQVYTRDPRTCCELFGQQYPEKAAAMWSALDLMAGSTDPGECLELIESLIQWLVAERARIYPLEVPKIAFIDDLGV
ncbi:nucleotidyltransferase-like protein [Streptomyces sp. 3211.6]|uniref:nucleotidyltransferase domain-containing protein n=1 Tax=Streptomyces TaxID=1883 RepID=UPI0009A55861|nr:MULTISPECIES: nucleotidyltransferase domain-containing protein [Streptomyces]RKT05895.1 nucleotidyltransferase-like protein [Streptomyces sp. 3211.6]RPF41849.1 nucleotidyltransferase-like protein [Streptomyces sp. Ag109_G2-6]